MKLFAATLPPPCPSVTFVTMFEKKRQKYINKLFSFTSQKHFEK
jgi:hypothetical protein